MLRVLGRSAGLLPPPLAPRSSSASALNPPCLICTLPRAAGEVGTLALLRTGGLGAPLETTARDQVKAHATCLMVEPGVCKGTMLLNPGGLGRRRAWSWGGQPTCHFALTGSVPGRSSAEAGAWQGLFCSLRGPFVAGGSRAGHRETVRTPQQWGGLRHPTALPAQGPPQVLTLAGFLSPTELTP